MPPEAAAAVPKTAVIGAGGFLGRRLLALFRQRFPDAVGTVRPPGGPGLLPLDLAAPDARPLRLARTGHRAAVICAAVPSLSRCEREPEATGAVNVRGTLALAAQLLDEGVVPVFLSSDYVFGGGQAPYGDEAPATPLCEYGRQKAAVEAGLRRLAPDGHLTLRLSKVYSLERGSATILDTFAGRLLAGEVRAADDQRFCPTLADDVVRAAGELLARGTRGTVNLCSPEGWSWHDLAVALAAELGLDAARVHRISIDDLGDGVRRPHDIRMAPARLEREGGHRFAATRDGIARVAAAWRQGAAGVSRP
jgi:dTDP-4-dehydrorhamnose reductase